MESSKRKNNESRLILTVVSLFFSFTFCVYAPLELYLTNINEFWFDLSQFWFVVVLVGIFVSILLILLGIILPLWARNLYIAGGFGFSLLMYVQSNFLNMDIGVLNGGSVDWASYRIKFLINFGIWVFVICLCMCIFNEKNKWMKTLVKYTSVCITLIQAVTLLVLLLTSKSDIDKSATSQYVSAKGIYEVSEDENIIVFLMDMFDDRYFKQLLEQEPELAEEFDGFTQYVNSTGNYSTTSYSVGTLLTGQYLRNTEETYNKELNALYEECETFDILSENGYRLDIYTYEGMIPQELKVNTSNYIEGGKRISNYITFTKYIYQLAAGRYMPDFVKQHVWMVGNEFDSLCERSGEADAHSVDNVAFYENMMDQGITVQDEKKCFKFIHLDAVHYPYTMNENVQRVEESGTSYLRCARGVVKILLDYMNGMKEAGVYDDSTIIIMADHGYYWAGVLTNPVLLVKPKDEVGTLQVSDAPVSHHDFQPSILSYAGLNENGEYGEAYLDIKNNEDRERLFYQYYLQDDSVGWKYRLIEYAIDPDGNERKNFHLTGVEYTLEGEKIDHFEKCSYCQLGEEEPNDNEARIVHE